MTGEEAPGNEPNEQPRWRVTTLVAPTCAAGLPCGLWQPLVLVSLVASGRWPGGALGLGGTRCFAWVALPGFGAMGSCLAQCLRDPHVTWIVKVPGQLA